MNAEEIILSGCRGEPGPLEPFVRYFLEHIPTTEAIILYGSCVNESTRKPTSFPDFYVLVEKYSQTFKHRKTLNTLLAPVMPPNAYFLLLKGENGETLRCKYNVVKTSRFIKEIAERPSDMYNLGRFGKKTVILYTRHSDVQQRLVKALATAFMKNLELSVRLMNGSYDMEKIILHTLSLSYRADFRVERDSKVMELFSAEKDFYSRIYSSLLSQLAENTTWVHRKNSHYEIHPPRFLRWRTRAFILWSRFRSVARWPKGIITFDNYVDYLLDKIERAKGIRIELTERERKYPLIFGWRHFFRLLRKGMIR